MSGTCTSPCKYSIANKLLNDRFTYARLLVVVSVVLPWNIAFEGDELMNPLVFDPLVDLTFCVDIILTFNLAYYIDNGERRELITSKKLIAKNYLKSWFILDLLSCLPLDYITQYSANNIAKIARVSKLQKLFKLLKIQRLLKLFTVKKRISESYFSHYSSKISSESMLFILVLLFLFCHFAACAWVLITHITLNTATPSWIEVQDLYRESSTDVYVMSMYYIV